MADSQLNRAHALGYTRVDDLRRAASAIRSREYCVAVFDRLSADAAVAGRLRNATSYLRVAEFFTPGRVDEKVARYRRYRELFDAAFADSGAVRHDVVYAGASLPAYRLEAFGRRSQGTVLLHGGFDSLIEEFFAIWQRIAAAGFRGRADRRGRGPSGPLAEGEKERTSTASLPFSAPAGDENRRLGRLSAQTLNVIAFEGPGQGGARALGGLAFDHDWEKPVAAVLDHFGIASAGLVGISIGGYWALRAAGREPRIDRVVSWPPVYDWLHRVPPGVRGAARAMLRRRSLMRWNVKVRTRQVPTLRQVVDQAMYLVDSDGPMDAVDWFLGMNADHIASQRVTQDVRLLCGEHDASQPPVFTRAQARALTAAHSVRTFTSAEQADQHCQMGNLELACTAVTGWLTDPGKVRWSAA